MHEQRRGNLEVPSRDCTFLVSLGLSVDDLSRLAASGGRGWLSTDHVVWVLSQLNTMQQEKMLICPNAVVNIPNEMSRKRKLFNFGTLKRLVLPLNVGKQNGTTFIGGVPNSANHWVLVVVELRPFKRIIYCDTLAWDPPSNIIDVVNNYTTHLPCVGSYGVNHLSLPHSLMATSWSGHQCDWRCCNYPLQTCCDMWGHCTGPLRQILLSVLYWSSRKRVNLPTMTKPTLLLPQKNSNIVVCRGEDWYRLCSFAA